jgi:hypothetical protein
VVVSECLNLETAEKFWIKFGIGGPCRNLFGKFHFDPYEPSVGPCYTKVRSRIALRPFSVMADCPQFIAWSTEPFVVYRLHSNFFFLCGKLFRISSSVIDFATVDVYLQ